MRCRPSIFDVELGQPPAQQAPARHPVGELPGARLQAAFTRYTMCASRPTPAISRKWRDTRAAVAGHVAHRNAARPQIREALGGALQTCSPSFISMASTLAVPPGRTASGRLRVRPCPRRLR